MTVHGVVALESILLELVDETGSVPVLLIIDGVQSDASIHKDGQEFHFLNGCFLANFLSQQPTIFELLADDLFERHFQYIMLVRRIILIHQLFFLHPSFLHEIFIDQRKPGLLRYSSIFLHFCDEYFELSLLIL